MKVLLVSVLLAGAPAPLLAASKDAQAQTQVQVQHVLDVSKLRFLGEVQEWQEVLAKLPPDVQASARPGLDSLTAAGKSAQDVAQIRDVQTKFVAWHQALMHELFPALPQDFLQAGAQGQLAQAQMGAFEAVAKLQQSALSAQRRSFFSDLKTRISLVSDQQALDRLFDNAGLSRPAPVVQAYQNGVYKRVSAYSPTKGLVVHEVPSPLADSDRNRYAKVIDYLKGRGADQSIIEMTIAEAMRQNVDPTLVLALVQQESGFQADATSRVGARGLMQIMPKTGQGLGVLDANELYLPLINLRAGISYLKSLLDRAAEWSWAGLSRAIASYNAGPGAVKKYGGIPPFRETIDYVKKVLANYLHLRKLAN